MGDCVGAYTFYTAQYTVPGDLAYASKIDVISGSDTSTLNDAFNSAADLGGSCQAFQNPPPSSLCTTGQGSTSTGSSSTSSIVSTISSSSTVSVSVSVTSSTSSITASSTTSSSVSPVETLHHRQSMGGYTLVGCQKEATNSRALTGASFAYDGMTLETCMGNCTGFYYWGAEYGRECELTETRTDHRRFFLVALVYSLTDRPLLSRLLWRLSFHN